MISCVIFRAGSWCEAEFNTVFLDLYFIVKVRRSQNANSLISFPQQTKARTWARSEV